MATSRLSPPAASRSAWMYVQPGQDNAAHNHEVEEELFVLGGFLNVFIEDVTGRRVDIRLGKWEGINFPPGVIHDYQNGADLFPGHARPRQTRDDGLRGRQTFQPALCASRPMGKATAVRAESHCCRHVQEPSAWPARSSVRPPSLCECSPGSALLRGRRLSDQESNAIASPASNGAEAMTTRMLAGTQDRVSIRPISSGLHT